MSLNLSPGSFTHQKVQINAYYQVLNTHNQRYSRFHRGLLTYHQGQYTRHQGLITYHHDHHQALNIYICHQDQYGRHRGTYYWGLFTKLSVPITRVSIRTNRDYLLNTMISITVHRVSISIIKSGIPITRVSIRYTRVCKLVIMVS